MEEDLIFFIIWKTTLIFDKMEDLNFCLQMEDVLNFGKMEDNLNYLAKWKTTLISM